MRLRIAMRNWTLAATLLAAATANAQVLATDQALTTIAPCRLIDTRVSNQRFAAGQTRTFDVYGTNLSAQGGSASGCGLPGFVSGVPQVQALAINFVAVGPGAGGHLRAWPSDQPFPSSSILNFQALSPNLNIANELPTAIRQDAPGGDLSIYASQPVDVVADVVGYYRTITSAAPAPSALPASGGGMLSGRINLGSGASCAPGAFAAYGYASGGTPASAVCQDCASEMSTLAPRSSCTAHDLAVKMVGSDGSARSIALVVDGRVTSLGCAVDGSTLTCDSGGATAAIGPGSEISMRVEQSEGGGALCAVAFGFRCD